MTRAETTMSRRLRARTAKTRPAIASPIGSANQAPHGPPPRLMSATTMREMSATQGSARVHD